MNRALRAATMGVLLLSPVALSACSAGQVTQTASQDRDKVGPMTEVEHILVRQVLLAYPTDESYAAGDDAELIMTIVNSSNEADTLVGIEGEGFDGVLVDDGSATSAPGTPTSPSAPQASTDVDIPVPADSLVQIGQDGETEILLSDLEEGLTVGQGVELTLTFERAGETTVRAIVDTPSRALQRAEPFDFHGEEHGESEGAEDVAREQEDEAGGGPGGSED